MSGFILIPSNLFMYNATELCYTPNCVIQKRWNSFTSQNPSLFDSVGTGFVMLHLSKYLYPDKAFDKSNLLILLMSVQWHLAQSSSSG